MNEKLELTNIEQNWVYMSMSMSMSESERVRESRVCWMLDGWKRV